MARIKSGTYRNQNIGRGKETAGPWRCNVM